MPRRCIDVHPTALVLLRRQAGVVEMLQKQLAHEHGKMQDFLRCTYPEWKEGDVFFPVDGLIETDNPEDAPQQEG